MILVVNTCKEKLSELEFVKPIEDIVGQCKTLHLKELKEEDISKAKKIIIAGTALHDFEYLKQDFSWIKTCEKPILGICAGMHMILKAFGHELEDVALIGPHNVQVVKENKFVEDDFNAYFLTTKIGYGLDVLASLEELPCIIKHPEKEIYGCLFHPEVMNKELIKNFLE